MRDAEHELSQHESAVEITPLPPEKELPEEQKLSPGMTHQSATLMGKAHRSGSKRYILIALALCLVLALFLVTVAVLSHQSPKPASHASSPTASSTLIPAATP